jgi:hypothetical protein
MSAATGRRRCLGIANRELGGLVNVPRRPALVVRICPCRPVRSAP